MLVESKVAFIKGKIKGLISGLEITEGCAKPARDYIDFTTNKLLDLIIELKALNHTNAEIIENHLKEIE